MGTTTSQQLKEWRSKHRLTLQELAQALGIGEGGRATVSGWESGDQPTPGRMLSLALRCLEEHPELMDPRVEV